MSSKFVSLCPPLGPTPLPKSKTGAVVSQRSKPMNNASTAKHKHTCTTDPFTDPGHWNFIGQKVHDMFDTMGASYLTPRGPSPNIPHLIHLHCKVFKEVSNCTRPHLAKVAATVSFLGLYTHQVALVSANMLRPRSAHQGQSICWSSPLWQNIPVQWHAGAPARRHSRPYLAQLLEICLLR